MQSNIPVSTREADLASCWRLAYLVTGDRQLARLIAAEVAQWAVEQTAGGTREAPSACRVHAAVIARARAATARSRAGSEREPLWTALQNLPRRQRAAVVARLAP